MLLKRLEINGFKSFAKPAVLEFPTKITAIVGPNGSGKSNVADSLRWVLGEQSMKSLRGKKGEDLIFGGSQQAARMGKASASLVFDNKKKVFPVEFDEVIISRRIYRDGVNEYLLNESHVRLKDIIELLSKVGLGASQHHIIAQGDADRILYASPKERKSIIEEALGLKIFELKKTEAERKLSGTDENIKQVESLRREIQPHLKYLDQQAQKMKNASELRKELEALTAEYAAREMKTLADEEAGIKKEKSPLADKLKVLETALHEAENILSKESGASSAQIFFDAQKKLDASLGEIALRRREAEREIIKMEAAAERPAGAVDDSLPKDKVKGVLLDLVEDLESASSFGTMEAVRNTIFSATQKIYKFLESLGDVKISKDKENTAGQLKQKKEAILKMDKEEEDFKKQKHALEIEYSEKAERVAKEGALFRQKTEEIARTRDELRNTASREEKLLMLKKEFELDFSGWQEKSRPGGENLSESERVQMRKKIERLKIRLEEAGGVDENVIKEYDETKKRDEFLAKELEDLKKAAESLGAVFEDLAERIEKDFDLGLEKINKLFGEFFHEIFGGGKAEIKLMKPQKKKVQHDEEEEEGWESELEEEEEGIEIIVDIPRKRIKSLNMLSGGERALTSIALLFAMSTVNPPPFLVLDETDAALDEANSNRYASMLRELGKKTQLVVVTHNRETMKAADVLYGVTMGNDGVSKLLSIKFEEAEDVLTKKKAA
ncbi:MAG: AAA family ATPase [bacterium]|nr:AAA family ATPase [bacterium]